jgi:hypothetical protein
LGDPPERDEKENKMIIQLRRPFAALLVLMLVVIAAPCEPSLPLSSQSAQAMREVMPDGLMSAFLAASSKPFAASPDGYRIHSGGLDFALDGKGLQANIGGSAWSLCLHALGRGRRTVALAEAEITQADKHLEYRRGVLTEWYRDTPLGVEQGFTVHQPPHGAGPLVLQLNLHTDLTGIVDSSGHGLSFVDSAGQTLRYDHLRAWDADSVPLEAYMSYMPGQVTLHINDQEAAYPITIDPLIYSEHQVIAADGEAEDRFSWSVALWDDTALIGACWDDVGANVDQGSAYVFTRSGTTWEQQAHLIASDGEEGDQFGISVALWDDTALVGSNLDGVGANTWQGSAYVFTRSGTAWSEQQQLTASDGAWGDQFGESVALWGDTALVGAAGDKVGENFGQGSAYVFTHSGTVWDERAHLIASDGAASHQFGRSVALWDDTALIGTDYGEGSAYVFARSGTTWSEQARLTASDGAWGDGFGGSIAVWGDTALVGAPYDGIGTNGHQGSVYVFTQTGTTWSERAHLIASDGAASHFYGSSVGLWQDMAFVGAATANGGQGSVYILTRSGTPWVEQQQLTASDGMWGDNFGWSMAVWGNSALVGAYADTVNGDNDRGSAYIYDALPYVTSIVRVDPDPTHASSLRFTVIFSEEVTGVDTSDFLPSTTGPIAGAGVTAVSGTGTTYTVTTSSGAGSGTLRLDIPATATITDLASNPLAGLPYTAGETYTVDRIAPTLLSITRADANPTHASSVRFAVAFSEDVTGVSASDFVLSTTGSVSGATVSTVSGSAAAFTVTVSTGSGSGTLRLDVPVSATIVDLVGNPVSGLPYTNGEVYTILYMVHLPLVLRAVP